MAPKKRPAAAPAAGGARKKPAAAALVQGLPAETPTEAGGTVWAVETEGTVVVFNSFTEYLKDSTLETWEACRNHPMTDAIGAGAVPHPAMKRYLVQDHKFLDAFVVLLSSMVAKAPTLEDRIPGCQFLALITGRENTYFERSMEQLGVTAEDRSHAPLPVPQAFVDLMLEAAQGSFAECLGVLIVAEWSYLEWAERVHPSRAADLPFWCGEWIDLHRGEGFEGLVAYLRGLLDKVAPTLPREELGKARANFARTIELEKAFWDMAWGES